MDEYRIPCDWKRKNKWKRILTVLFAMILFFSIAAFAAEGIYCVLTADSWKERLLWLILTGSVGIPALYVFWCWIESEFAEYAVTSEGMAAKYPLQKERLIAWDEFQQICACLYVRKLDRLPVICCVQKGEKPNIYGRWKAYNEFHHKTVITFPYSDVLFDEIARRSSVPVVDLRENPLYKY